MSKRHLKPKEAIKFLGALSNEHVADGRVGVVWCLHLTIKCIRTLEYRIRMLNDRVEVLEGELECARSKGWCGLHAHHY